MGTFNDEAINKILLGRRAPSRVPFPMAPEGSGIMVGLRGLADREIDGARLQAIVHLGDEAKRAFQDPAFVVQIDPEWLEREQERQMLALACVDPDAPEKPFFVSVVQVRSLDSVVVRRLWELFLHHQNTVNPRGSLTPEKHGELVDALKKGLDDSAFLAAFDRDTLVSLLRTLVNQPST